MLAVVGVHRGEERFVARDVPGGIEGVDPEQLLRPGDLVLPDVPLPAPEARQALGLRDQLLAASQLVLGLAANGDVDAGPHHPGDRAVGPRQGGERGVDVDDPVLARQDGRLEARGLAARGAGDGVADPRALDLRMAEPRQIDEPMADDVPAQEAARRQRRLVGVEDDPVGREQAHEREDSVEHVAKPRLGRDDQVEPSAAPELARLRHRGGPHDLAGGGRAQDPLDRPLAETISLDDQHTDGRLVRFDRHSCALPPKENRVRC